MVAVYYRQRNVLQSINIGHIVIDAYIGYCTRFIDRVTAFSTAGTIVPSSDDDAMSCNGE